jgi:ParB/RepB/Spo0J family partition protein
VSTAALAEGTLTVAHISGLSVHPLNRKRLGDMKELTADVKANGVEVPLVIRVHPKNKKQPPVLFQILAGARRFLAAREAGLDTVPAILVPVTMDDAAAFRFLVRENLHRENPHPLDEALYFKQSLEDGLGIEEIAVEIGKPTPYVHLRLKLSELIAPLVKMYEGEKIGHAVAMELARLTPENQKEAVDWITDRVHYAGYVAKQDVRKWILSHTVLVLARAKFNTKDEKLWTAAGACTDCPKRTGNVPSLFGDLTDKDSCTDRRCFEQKAQRSLLARIKKLNEAGEDWCPLATHWGENKKFQGMPINSDWNESKKSAKGARRGIVVMSPDLEAIGNMVWFVKRSTSMSSSTRSPQDIAAEKRAERQGKVQKHTRELLFDAMRDHNPTDVTDLHFVALQIFTNMWMDAQMRLARTLGWELVKQKNYSGWDTVTTAKKRIAQMGKADVMRFLHAIALVREVDHGSHHEARTDPLLLRAKALKVKLPPLVAKAEAKFPTAKQKATKRKAKR